MKVYIRLFLSDNVQSL